MNQLWTCQDGRKLKLSEMTTTHIKNALNMLRNKGYVSPKSVVFYLTCAPPSGEYAQLAFDQECDYIFNAPNTEWIDIFEEELEKRKVDN